MAVALQLKRLYHSPVPSVPVPAEPLPDPPEHFQLRSNSRLRRAQLPHRDHPLPLPPTRLPAGRAHVDIGNDVAKHGTL